MSEKSSLPELMENYPYIKGYVEDLSISQERAADYINQELALNGVEQTTTRFSVKRARNKLLNQGILTDPLPGGMDKVSVKPVTRKVQQIPAWTPGIEFDEKKSKGAAEGELRTVPKPVESSDVDVTPDEADLFSEFGLDPQEWEITQMRRSRWQSGDKWLEAYRASFVKREHNRAALSDVDISYLLSQQKPFQRPTETSDKVIMSPVGDTQLGKPDGGGTEATIKRFAALTEQLRQRLEEAGGVAQLILPWLGDCLEGYVSQGGKNISRLDISITEQVRVYRRLMWHQITTLAPYAKHILVPVVGGNHDETYREQTLSPNDSWAIEGASAIAFMISQIDEYSHVQFIFPEEGDLGVTVQLGNSEAPYIVHFEHGHMARSPEKMPEWWKNQSHGRQKAGQADMLVTAHWHHLRILQSGRDRIWLQIPAMDGGSDWFRRKSGDDASPGLASMELGGGAFGFKNLEIHSVDA